MIGSSVVTGRELQDFLSGAREAALAGQYAESVCHFLIVRAVGRGGALLSLTHRHELPDVWLRHQLLSEK